jgi:hypothetical protein
MSGIAVHILQNDKGKLRVTEWHFAFNVTTAYLNAV